MLDQSFELRGCLRWRESTSYQLHFVLDLGTQVELGVEPVRQAERIPFISLHHPFGSFLHVDAVDGDIQIQQILLKQAMIMASVLQQNRDLLDGHQLAKTIHESPKTLT